MLPTNPFAAFAGWEDTVKHTSRYKRNLLKAATIFFSVDFLTKSVFNAKISFVIQNLVHNQNKTRTNVSNLLSIN